MGSKRAQKGGIKMEDKIEFGDLDNWLKIPVVIAYGIIGVWGAMFIVAFTMGLMGY